MGDDRLDPPQRTWEQNQPAGMRCCLIDLDREIDSTRRLLERYPLGKGEWQPHDTSRPLSALATHVANIPHHGANILITPEMDIASRQALRLMAP